MKFEAEDARLPSSDTHHCFGCSPVNPAGLQMKFFTRRDQDAVFSRIAVPAHLCGWNNLVHGGVLSTILDEIMSWAAIYLLKGVTLTTSMTVDFIRPVNIGQSLEAQGRVRETKGKRDAVMEGFLYNAEGDLCARSTGVYKVFSPAVAARLGIADESSLKWFETIFDLR